MPGAARLYDIWAGICCCHSNPSCIGMSGPIVTASDNVITNTRGQSRLYDVVVGACGHAGLIVTSSPDVITNVRGSGRLTDVVAGCTIGVIVTSSEDVIING